MSERAMKRMRDFISYLHRVSTRQPGEMHDAYKDLKLSIVLVGRSEVIRYCRFGHEPYVDYIKNAIKEGIETFYVLARGKVNSCISQLVAMELERQNKAVITDRFVDEVEHNGSIVNVSYFRLNAK